MSPYRRQAGEKVMSQLGHKSTPPAKRRPRSKVPARQSRPTRDVHVIAYHSKNGVDDYVRRVASATPMQLVQMERIGVVGSLIKDLSKRMEIPSTRIFRIIGIPKATAEKKASAKEMVAGRGGQAAIGVLRLLGIAQEIVRDSTATEAQGFDAAKWLGQWIERPQPSLGGRKPADLLDTPTGVEIVARLLGSIQSGAFQ
jgi:putative toxin-antitoxin system antitoxin component (TIGR02293 family)